MHSCMLLCRMISEFSEGFTIHETAKFVSTHCEFTHKTNADLA